MDEKKALNSGISDEIKIMIKAMLIMFFGLISFQYFYGGSLDNIPVKEKFEIVAHRGFHTNWEKDTYDPINGCEAKHIYKPIHDYIENTIESIGAAFNMGATIVEIDIRRTSDNQLVVYHDDSIACRTNGKGKVNEHSLHYLRTLDIGYGYTHDNGQTFLLRGKGIGKIPTLIEVLKRFPKRKFLIDDKDFSMITIKLLGDIISSLPVEQQKLLYYWGSDKTYKYIHNRIPVVTRLFFTRESAKNWMMPYVLSCGISDFSNKGKGLVMGLPPQYIKYICGWPYRFLEKVSNAGVKLYLMIDTEEHAKEFLHIPVDGILTDHIEIVGKFYRKPKR